MSRQCQCRWLQWELGQGFRKVRSVLTILKETVESSWVENQLALRIFFWIAEMYKVQVQNEHL